MRQQRCESLLFLILPGIRSAEMVFSRRLRFRQIKVLIQTGTKSVENKWLEHPIAHHLGTVRLIPAQFEPVHSFAFSYWRARNV